MIPYFNSVKYFSLVNVLHYYVSYQTDVAVTLLEEFRCQQTWLNSCSMRPPGFYVVIVVFVLRGGKPADVLLVVVSGISIDMVTLASIPIILVSVSREAH